MKPGAFLKAVTETAFVLKAFAESGRLELWFLWLWPGSGVGRGEETVPRV